MNSTETTEELLHTRNKLADILESHGKLPDEWLVSAENLQAPYEDRVQRLYTELTTKVDYIGQMARNVAQLPTAEQEIRSYGPFAQDERLLEDLSSISSFHRIQHRAAIASAAQASMTIRYTAERVCNTAYFSPPGIYSSSTGFKVKKDELDEAVSSYFTFFRPYPPLHQGDWISGIIREAIVGDWQTDLVYTTWTWVALRWAEAASTRLNLSPAWLLDSEAIQNELSQFLYRPIIRQVYVGPVHGEWGPLDTENKDPN